MTAQSTPRDFYIGATLVLCQSLIGFWRYPPSSGTPFYIAVVASIAITICFFQRRTWARFAAIIVAVFGILGELPNVSGGAITPILSIVLYILVMCWLNRKSVQDHFKHVISPEKPVGGA
jgi:hypothetical protein